MLWAGGLDKVIAKITSASTTVTASSTTTEDRVTGYIDRIDVSYGNSTSTVFGTVTASNVITGITTTLPVAISATATSASTQLTNYVQRLLLFDEAITVAVTGAAYAGQSVMVTVFYERP
jgi:hypothetical protein